MSQPILPDSPDRPRPTFAVLGILVVLFALGAFLRVHYFPVAARTLDERIYARYSEELARRGPAALPAMVRDYIDRPAMHVCPPPTRIGYIGLGAAAMRLSGAFTANALAWVSFAASVLLMLLLVRFGLEFLGGWTTAVALAFFVASPLDLAMARRAWVDELLSLVALAMLYALLRVRVAPGRRRWAAAVLALGVFSLWLKETGGLFFILGMLGLAWAHGRGAAAAAAAGALALALGIAVLVAASGGPAALAAAVSAAARAAATNEYVLRYQTGDAMYYVRGLAALQPAPMLLGFLVAALVACRVRLRGGETPAPRRLDALRILSAFSLVLVAVAIAHPQKNLRFIGAAFAPVYLLAGAGIQELVAVPLRDTSRALARTVGIAVAAFLLLSLLADRARFEHHFVRARVPDLATPWFTGR